MSAANKRGITLGLIAIITLYHCMLANRLYKHIFKYTNFIRLIGSGIVIAGMLIVTRQITGVAGFLALTIVMGVVFYGLPRYVNISALLLMQHVRRLWQHRMLILLWLKYDVLVRYRQKLLGILWIMLLPLITSLILALVFSQFLRVNLTDVPYIAFLLTALVPWMLFSQGVFGSTTAILANMNLINTVPLPRDVLVIKILGESLVDGAFMLVCMLLINLLFGIRPGRAILFLPILLLIQACGTLGLMFFVSAASVLVRDVPQLVSVAMQLLFYVTPILYPIALVPQQFQPIFWFNPLSFLVEAYRSIILANQLPDGTQVYSALLFALLLLFGGYLFFKVQDHRFADIL